MKQVTAIQLDDKGLVQLATLSDGVVLELDELKYQAKLGKIPGLQIARNPFTSQEFVVASKELKDLAL